MYVTCDIPPAAHPIYNLAYGIVSKTAEILRGKHAAQRWP